MTRKSRRNATRRNETGLRPPAAAAQPAASQVPGSPPGPTGVGLFPWIAVSLVVAAALLRGYRIGTQEVWLDEAFSALLVERPTMLPVLASESNPPLYFLLLKAFCAVFGTTPAALRALSALFSAACVGTVLFYGARLVNKRFALGAGVFLVLSPYSLYYGQEARAYSLLILLSLLSIFSCYEAVVHRSRAAVWVFGLSVLAAGYTHYLAALTLLPLALWLAARCLTNTGERAVILRLLLTFAAATAACAAWALPSLMAQGSSNPHLWIAEQWRHLDKLWIVPRSLLVLLLGSAKGLTPLFMKQWTLLVQPTWLVILTLGACITALGLAWQDTSTGEPGRPSKQLGVLLVAGTLVPLAALFAISFVKPLYVVARYDIVAFPYLVLLAGWVVDRLCSSLRLRLRLGAVAAAVFLLCLGYKDWLYYESAPVFQDYDAERSASLLDGYVADGEAVVFTGMRGPSVLYYLSGRGYQWDGRYCRNPARQLVFDCRIVPYTDTGVPFVMGGTVTTPVTAASAVADFQPFVTLQARRGSPVWLVLSRQKEAVNVTINRRLDVLLHQSRYDVRGLPPEMRGYQLLKYELR